MVAPDVVAKLAPSADEARILKPVGDFIEAKGALPDVGGNGRHSALLSRLTGEMRQYVMQDAHPALCAGADELVEFYSGQAAPLKKRNDDVVAMAKQAKALSEQRVRAVAVAEQRAYDKAAADAAKVEEQRTRLIEAHKSALAKAQEAAAAAPPAIAGTAATPTGGVPPGLPVEPKLPDVPALPLKPNGPAKLEDYAVVGFPSLLSEALRPLLAQAKIVEVVAETTPVKMLVKARTILLDPAVEQLKASADVTDAAMMALRMLEARVYADLYVNRFKDLDVTVFGALTELRKAHAASCICRD